MMARSPTTGILGVGSGAPALALNCEAAVQPFMQRIMQVSARGAPALRRLRLIPLVVLLYPAAGLGQAVSRDTAAYARAEQLFWRADTLAQSNDRAQRLQALTLWREAVALYEISQHSDHAASTYDRIAQLHYKSGKPDSSIFYYARALPLWRDVKDGVGEAMTLNQIGLAYDDLGSADTALSYYERALPVWRNAGDGEGEARTLSNIGVLMGAVGRPDSALAYHARALAIQRRTRDAEGEATTLGNMGALQDAIGRPDSALSYFARALQIQRDVEDQAGEATTLGNIGAVHDGLGRPDSALAYYARSLPIWRSVGDQAGEAATLHYLGVVHYGVGRADSALAYFARALTIRRAVGDRIGEASTLNNIGMVHARLGRPDAALAYYAQALPIRHATGNRAGEAITRQNIGYTFLSMDDASSGARAAAAFDTAAALRSRIRRSAGGDANAVSLGESSGATFVGWSLAWQRLALEAQARGDSSTAHQAVASSLAAAERGRAQALRDLLDGNRAAGAALNSSDTIAGADLAAEADRLLEPLRATRTALLYYMADGDTLRAWFFSPVGGLKVLPALSATKRGLAEQIMTARSEIGADEASVRQRRGESPRPNGVNRKDGDDEDEEADEEAAVQALRALSAALPAEMESRLPPGTELVIVPHGTLGQVPFAALTVPGDTVPLGVRNPLRYAPSLRALGAAEASGGLESTVGVGKARGRALVVGNPEMPHVYDGADYKYQLSELPGAAEEGRWVARRLGTQVLTGAGASESVIRRLISGASIVHLATHGLAYGTEARVRDSYVALAPGAGEDGFLTLGELLDDASLRLTADLIVLSACQTGLGEPREAEGTVGLQRGLLAKGARSVLVSLWSVNDAATQLLMERFYTHWLDESGLPSLTKAEALRRAQSDVRADQRFSNPRYWAAFQLVGAQ